MLSETRIDELQEDLLLLYQEIENDLLVSIVQDIDINKDINIDKIESWHAQKLGEIGAVNKRNKKIIAKYSGRTDEEVEKIFTNMSIESVEDDEKTYKKAIEKGLIEKQVPIADSPAINRVIKKAIEETDEVINLVNTKALQSANKEFRQIINTAFIQVDSGIYDYKTAIRRAVFKLADKGISGQTYEREDGTLINYSLDAAVRREVVTSSLQTARDVQDERAKEYGSDLFEVTSHVGARPKCARDQGRIYSKSGKSKKYKAFSDTSEGDADGLFGVNCRHQKFPYFEGISIKRNEPVPLRKNKKIAEEQTKQRYLERQVRQEKRRLIMLDEIGDVDGFTQSSVKLKRKEANLNAFMEQTGRTQQVRTQEPGFNRSLSQKAVHANKREQQMDQTKS